jgi:hypothetical protein
MEAITLSFEVQQMKSAARYIINHKNFWYDKFFLLRQCKENQKKAGSTLSFW